MTKTSEALRLGLQHHQAGQLRQAEQFYQQVLQVEPNHGEALHLSGVVAYQLGNWEAAIAQITQAIQRQPQQAEYYNSLGEVYRSQGQLANAVVFYTQALQINPAYPAAYYNLGNTLQALGEIETAIEQYRQTIALQPNLAQAHHNLGFLLKKQGQQEAAIAAYRQAIALKPDYALALSNLGVALADTNQLLDAIAILEQATRVQPNFADAHLNLGNTLKRQGNVTAALIHYQQAIQLRPDWAEAHFSLGTFFKDQGQVTAAITHYHQALESQPTYAEAYWNQQLILPILYETPEDILEWRQRLTDGLQNIYNQVSQATVKEPQLALAGVSSVTNFFLQYQGLNDLSLQQTYGQIVHQVVSANYPQWAKKIQRKVINRKIRIGFLSHFFREHTIAKLFLGWLQHLDSKTFQIHSYYLGRQRDQFTDAFIQASHAFYQIPDNFEAVCQQLERDRLDILIFTDIGMNADSYKLAALRFAPVQCVTWGHPITSGLPTIDYYLSSELMEPEDYAQTHYSETLVCLPQIGIAYAKPKPPTVQKTRIDFQIPEDAIVYLSCQSLYKYLPQFDFIFPAIAKSVSQAQFVFLASPTKGDYITLKFQERLQHAFESYDLDSRCYCHFLPRLSWDDYLSLNLVSDIFLDTFSWSGGNTALEAIACNLPIVTCPGEFMRGRHAYGMLRALGVMETIANDAKDYIEIAILLGLNPHWRNHIVAQMQAHQDKLYDDLQCVRALEDFIRKVVR
jgi:predicted O-linked N-acetylglucosamine transferase (SPINDLY family)